jgi:two-component system, chemotaxis family, chemotaxis protein CheY
MSMPKKILILEDSPMMCSLYRMVLSGVVGELLFAADGVEGLDRAASESDVDLYLVDVNLPRLDGIAFIRRLRGELGASAPVVVISTECGDQDRRLALEAGADAYLCKPWTPQALMATITGLSDRETV